MSERFRPATRPTSRAYPLRNAPPPQATSRQIIIARQTCVFGSRAVELIHPLAMKAPNSQPVWPCGISHCEVNQRSRSSIRAAPTNTNPPTTRPLQDGLIATSLQPPSISLSNHRVEGVEANVTTRTNRHFDERYLGRVGVTVVCRQKETAPCNAVSFNSYVVAAATSIPSAQDYSVP